MASETLYLVDGSGYIYRAFYAIRSLTNRQGVPTNAVFGFARMLIKLLREKKPHLLGIAFDTDTDNFRHEIYSEYKATRDEKPEDLAPQFPLIHELVSCMEIPLLAHTRYEADDIIATLAHQGVASGYDVVVVSADKDLMQLVGDHVRMYDPMKDVTYDRAGVIEKFGVPPELVADVLALAGDTSDNVPGVPKVGMKSAAKLVDTYGDVEKVIAGLEAQAKLKAVELSVIENAHLARLSKQLTLLAKDAPFTLDIEKLKYTAPRAELMAPFLRKIDALQLLRELGLTEIAAAPPPGATSDPDVPDASPEAVDGDDGDEQGDLFGTPTEAEVVETRMVTSPLRIVEEPVSIDRSVYRMVTTLEELDAFLALARKNSQLTFDTETTSQDPMRAILVGVALSTAGTPAVYVPVSHRYLGAPPQLSTVDVLDRLRPLLEDSSVRKIAHNAKYDIIVLARAGIDIRGAVDDTMIAAYILDPSRLSYSMDTLAREVLGHDTIRYDDVTGTGKTRLNFEEVPLDRATEYAAEDADVTQRLASTLMPRVDLAGQSELYSDLEMPLTYVLADMERTGIRVDHDTLASLGNELGERIRAIEIRAHASIGEPVNLGSPKQLAELFFVKLGYPAGKKTRTGFSTDSEVLEVLAKDYELPRIVLEHRLVTKLKSTYVDALPRMVNPDTGRVHTTFNQTGAATGRLSSTDPNLQNIPIRTEDGRRIRAAFVPEPGWTMISADYSQIELRIMAHLSEDPDFIEAFQRGEDIHARTAREILKGFDEREARRRAKAINFGILYGISDFGLSKNLAIPRAEAGAYIRAYFARYPRIRHFLDATINEALERGFVGTIFGRRRFLPDLASKNRTIRQGAERIAMNTPMQGSAADIIKVAMLRIHKRLREEKLKGRLLLQVHDELVLEAPPDEAERVGELVKHEMQNVVKLRVPLDVDVGTGPNWALAH
ncbi:MAG: DNA polymerase I [Myxococcota bacterium]